MNRIIAALSIIALSVFGAQAQSSDDGALEITVAGGEFKPISLAAPGFFAAPGDATDLAAQIRDVALADLAGSGLFRVIPPEAYIQQLQDFDAEPQYADWQAINADALVTGNANIEPDGRIRVQFRLFDSFAAGQVEGLQFFSDPADFRRIGHKIADAIYTRLTGEGPYFDSRIVYVHESGTKGKRVKRLAIMDQDGANNRFLTDGRQLVVTPRVSPDDQEVVYISFERGEPQIFLMNLATGQQEVLGNFPGMSFAPRFSPDGRQVLMSLTKGANTDIYVMDLASRRLRQLTDSPAIETAPSYSPDGSQIVFESDRGGGQQIYVMSASGGPATRISFGQGRYGTPVWSPRGDLIAFTKSGGGQFAVGVMRTDGSDERILDSSFLSEGPTWAPNGRVLAFFRESAGANGAASLWSVDITGRNLKRLAAPGAGSDPAWSPILP
ncbi:Tol-Pal system protein TolB [Pikeienuella piscinae]|uniref:Tol-Pal system protein TolB n=1 Tax=Pikeienuella piscinae TaxID=2748098 RepID=A0A7L5BVZ8_9RHOB|nr:Tol-Pal system beta propeller repeat protein TolB [Pikeienuella piscinae]QIE55303.1 Tol-Pal system protein TolB [Pikeienuella piscinae]